MAQQRPFRFGQFSGMVLSRDTLTQQAQRAEAVGYSIMLIGDHVASGGLAPSLAILAAANATQHLRFGTHVLNIDLRNPVLLAQETATLDLLTHGRLELGLGAGWLAADYTATGMPFDPVGTRVARLIEVVPLLKQLYSGERVTVDGKHYQVRDAMLRATPVQKPYPPVFIGGGSQRILRFAAREASIVGFNPRTTSAGQLDHATMTAQATMQKLAWVRDAAGPRFADLELNMICNRIIITSDRRSGYERLLASLHNLPAINTDLSMDDLRDSPHFLVGSIDEIIADLRERRERFGISYYSLAVDAENQDALDTIVERLVGT